MADEAAPPPAREKRGTSAAVKQAVSFTIEIDLVVAQPPQDEGVGGEASTDAPLSGGSGEGSTDGSFDGSADADLLRPSLRYTFLDGSGVETSTLGKGSGGEEGGNGGEGSWVKTLVDPAEEVKDAVNKGEAKDGGKEGGGEGEGGEATKVGESDEDGGGSEVNSGDEKDGAGADGGEPRSAPARRPERPAGLSVWRWSKTHSGVSVDAAFAAQVHNTPFLSFFLAADKRVQPPPEGKDGGGGEDEDKDGGGEGAGEVEEGAPAERTRDCFCSLLELDASALLDGDTQIERILANEGARAPLVAYRAAVAVDRLLDAGYTEDVARVALMQVGVTEGARAGAWLEKPGQSVGAARKATKLRGKGEMDRRWQSALMDTVFAAPPEGVEFLRISIRADKPMLTPALRHQMNPMAISLTGVRALPGIHIETVSEGSRWKTTNSVMAAKMLPTKFSMLSRHCAPISATLKFPTGKRAAGGGGAAAAAGAAGGGGGGGRGKKAGGGAGRDQTMHRVVTTTGIPQLHPDPAVGRPSCAVEDKDGPAGKLGLERKVVWNHKTVFLAAMYDRDELVQLMESTMLEVELHDRDMAPEESWPNDGWESMAGRWAGAVAAIETEKNADGDGGDGDGDGGGKDAEGDEGKTGGDGSSGSSGSGWASLTSLLGGEEPASRGDVDVLAAGEVREACFPNAGDRFAHGIARFSLRDLLNQGKELSRGFKTTALGDEAKWGTKEMKSAANPGAGGNKKGRKAPSRATTPNTGGGDGAELGRMVKCSESVVPNKRRIIADEDEDQKSWDYDEEERMVRCPAPYTTLGTSFSVEVSIVRPLYTVTESISMADVDGLGAGGTMGASKGGVKGKRVSKAAVGGSSKGKGGGKDLSLSGTRTIIAVPELSQQFTETLGATQMGRLNDTLRSTFLGVGAGTEAEEQHGVPRADWWDKTFTENGTPAVVAARLPPSDVRRGRRPRPTSLFERVVYVFPYGNDERLRAIQETIQRANEEALLASLKEAAASIRSYQLTGDEAARANAGELDIITGFTVMDTTMRIVVAEGLGAGAMQALHGTVKRTQANDDTMRVLADPAARFTHRLYTNFNVDLKRIKLRGNLHDIVESPLIYNRATVSEDCFEALQRLFQMTKADRLRLLRESTGGGFPEVRQLLRLESMYGEAISVEDMDGKPQDLLGAGTVRFAATSGGGDDTGGLTGTMTMTAGGGGIGETRGSSTNKSFLGKSVNGHGAVTTATSVSTRLNDATRKESEKGKVWKAATDQLNPEYEEALQTRALARSKLDYLGDSRRQVEKVRAEVMAAREERDNKAIPMFDGCGGEIYIYSGQKRAYLEWQKEDMRQRLAAGDKSATYTYSEDYHSLSMCMVNEEEIDLQAKLASKAKFTTPSGFVYPAPKDPALYNRHPRQLSEARKEDLRTKWVENENHPINVQPDAVDDISGRPSFDDVPSLIPPKGYHADGSENPEFFQSVHLCGDAAAAEMVQDEIDAKKAWADLVVTDTLHFQPHYGSGYTNAGSEKSALGPGRASQLDRTRDVLAGKARKRGIKVVRRSKLPSGKTVKLKTAPSVTIFAEEGGRLYNRNENPVDFTETMRPNDMNMNMTDKTTGEPVRFETRINADLGKPKTQTFRYNPRIAPIAAGDRKGGAWGATAPMRAKPPRAATGAPAAPLVHNSWQNEKSAKK
jgi:hypothetical protein